MSPFSREEQIAWAAGLFEGEGSIFETFVKSKTKTYRYVRMYLKSTDEDTVDQFHDFCFGWGKVYSTSQRTKRTPSDKDSWFWQLSNQDQIKELVRLFWPYLSLRRKEKSRELGMA